MEAQNNKVVLYIHYKQQEQAYMCVDQVEWDLPNYFLVKIEYVESRQGSDYLLSIINNYRLLGEII